MPRQRLIPDQTAVQELEQPAKHNDNIHFVEIMFGHLFVGSTETSNMPDNGIDIYEAMSQVRTVCIKDRPSSMEVMCPLEGVVPVLAVRSMHPSHFCRAAQSHTSISYPFRR